MSTAVRFLDHPGFHRSFLALTAGAALGGSVAAGAGMVGGPLVGGAVGAVGGLAWASRRRGELPAVTPRRALLVMVAATAAGLWAAWAARTVMGAQLTAGWSAWASGAIAGALVGLAASLALALRHVALVADPVAAAYRALPTLTGEARELVERGRTIWLASASQAVVGDDNRDLVKDGVLTLFGVARRLAATPPIDPAAIDRRITELDARIEACTDAVAREQFRDARGALCDQRRYVDTVGAARERILARMHHCVATLEKFRMACAQLDAAAAAREAADARSAMSVLGELGDGLAIVGADTPALPA